jgi:hypothetical protein
MPGRTKSDELKTQMARTAKDLLYERAVKIYKAKQAKPALELKKGLRTVCKEVSEAHNLEYGQWIPLAHTTLSDLAAGGTCKSDSNRSEAHCSCDEEEVLIALIIEEGNRGWPLSHRRLKDHVDKILTAHIGPEFPGVGKNWTQRFVMHNHSRIQMYKAQPLESAHGHAVNLTTNKQWMDMLGSVIAENGIVDETMWAADESGFQPANGSGERVIGGRGKKVQHQTKQGS